MAEKVRLDILLAERGMAPSREVARRMIMAGEVRVDGQVRDKPGLRVARDVKLSVREMPRFVSRGGEKLAAALAAFSIDVRGRVCADVGALDYRLRSDDRVVVMERTNARYVEVLDEPVSVVVVDASFISLQHILPVVAGWLDDPADVIPLIKPQFEAGRGQVGKGGVVRDPQVHRAVLSKVLAFAQAEGYTVRGLIQSPLKGPAGNIEFLAWLQHSSHDGVREDIERLIDQILDGSTNES